MILPDLSTKSHTLDLNWEDFELGFWHPFGSHGRESPEDIISRKRSETDKNGWTLWSFQYRRPEALDAWYRELSFAKPRGPVVVFCSMGHSAIDPDRPGTLTRTANCMRYRFIGDGSWRAVPQSSSPFRAGKDRGVRICCATCPPPDQTIPAPFCGVVFPR